MNQRSLCFGILITVLWLMLIVVFAIFGDLTFPQSLNELGDFLAGIFAPIAFFWLVLGYMQQAKQLEQNTQALKQQEQALQLQVSELRENIEQQKQLVQIEQRKNEESHIAIAPYFNFKEAIICCLGISYINGEAQTLEYELIFLLENIGTKVWDVSILSENKEFLCHFDYIDSNEQAKKCEIPFGRLNLEAKEKIQTGYIYIRYENKYGRLEVQKFKIAAVFNENSCMESSRVDISFCSRELYKPNESPLL